MASQPIYGENGEVLDYYDDGIPEELQPAQVQETAPEQRTETPQPGLEAAQEEVAGSAPRPWVVPDMLKGANDLLIGMTVHHDDGDLQGPLVSLCVREIPDGTITVKTYRAAELSQRAFLDNLQKAIAVTMQAHFLAGAERQRRRLEEEAKRKVRQSQASTKPVSPPTPASTMVQPTTSPASPQALKPEKKYATVSMFD